MRWAILGGGNPYALNLAQILLLHGHEVIGIGRSALKGPAFTLGVERMGYRYHVYSIGPDTEFIIDLLDEYEPKIICNLAAQGEGQASFTRKNVKYFYKTNVEHLIELAEALCPRDWLGRFIQVGSSEVYGSVSSAVDEKARTNPTSKYANSKLTFDNHLQIMTQHDSFPAIVVRPSNAYCPGQQLHRVIPKTFISALRGQKLKLQGGGAARKSYLHADDLSRAILLLAEEGKVGEVYNCGPAEPISIRRLVELCAMTMQKPFEEVAEVVGERTGQDGCYWLDSSKLRGMGWKDSITIGLGLSGMLDWIKNYPELLDQTTEYRIRA